MNLKEVVCLAIVSAGILILASAVFLVVITLTLRGLRLIP